MVIEPKIKYVYLDHMGNYFRPTAIVMLEKSKADLIDKDMLHRISEMAEYTIEYAKQNNKTIIIRKEAILNSMIEISDLEVLEGSDGSDGSDGSVLKTDLNIKKDQIRLKVNSKMTQAINSEAMFALYNFNILNAKLGSLGYIITDSNKQEQYIKIIEKDDEQLLDDLEAYLDAKSKLDEYYKIYKRTQFIKKELQYAKTIEEADKLFDDFIED